VTQGSWSKNLPPILFGSHIDTVPEGGRYDGALGSLAGIETMQVLEDVGVVTHHPLEVVLFNNEEGGLIGSRALAGDLSPHELEEVSQNGITHREGIRRIGGDPENLTAARRRQGGVRGYLELHVEQGGVLEESGVEIGIVDGIVGMRWEEVTIEGAANHAGTTPMDRRHDALLAAARLVDAVNGVVTEAPGRQVGTVGRIEVFPGAPNIIPGRVVMTVELRDLSPETLDHLTRRVAAEGTRIAGETGTHIRFRRVHDNLGAPTDPEIRNFTTESARALGLSFLTMPSGAGHDAQSVARIAPVGMIFVPSVGGISHSPKEHTRPQDVENGANVLLQTILRLDTSEAE
jgi:N-carbamoyl-L-amino-acid hydrolase